MKYKNNNQQEINKKIYNINKKIKYLQINKFSSQIINSQILQLEKQKKELKFLIELTPYQKSIQQKKIKSQQRILKFKKRILELKKEQKILKENNQTYTYINEEIHKLYKVIKKIKFEHLSEKQKIIRNKNKLIYKNNQYLQKNIIKTSSTLVKDIFFILEKLSKNKNTTKISYNEILQFFYKNKKFRNFNTHQLQQLENLGWSFNKNTFHFYRVFF